MTMTPPEHGNDRGTEVQPTSNAPKKKTNVTSQNYSNNAIAFVNDRDRKTDRDPHLKGNGSIDCPNCGRHVEFWLSIWRKTGQRAGEFLSLSFRCKETAAATTTPTRDLDAVFPPSGGRNR
jgi:hypothetical protein